MHRQLQAAHGFGLFILLTRAGLAPEPGLDALPPTPMRCRQCQPCASRYVGCSGPSTLARRGGALRSQGAPGRFTPGRIRMLLLPVPAIVARLLRRSSCTRLLAVMDAAAAPESPANIFRAQSRRGPRQSPGRVRDSGGLGT